MVWVKLGTVLFVRHNDIARRIERGFHVDGCAVRSRTTVLIGVVLRQFVLRTSQAHVSRTRTGLMNARSVEQHSQRYARPVRVSDGARPPREPNRRLDQVLFLPTVPRAHHQARERVARHFHQLVHTDLERFRDVATNVNLVRVPIALRHRAVIPHDVQVHRRDESVIIQLRKRRLDVKRVFPGQTNQIPITTIDANHRQSRAPSSFAASSSSRVRVASRLARTDASSPNYPASSSLARPPPGTSAPGTDAFSPPPRDRRWTSRPS